ncbi:MAG: hypothetical protein ACJAVN_001674 [Roseivirga sp.]|jgi:hypothetical protein
MKKLKALSAATLMLLGTVGITQNISAHCIACNGIDLDGRCYGVNNLQCVDEKSWWQGWTCANGIGNTADCPVEIL